MVSASKDALNQKDNCKIILKIKKKQKQLVLKQYPNDALPTGSNLSWSQMIAVTNTHHYREVNQNQNKEDVVEISPSYSCCLNTGWLSCRKNYN